MTQRSLGIMRLTYNSPVVLTFTFAAAAVLAIDTLVGGWLIPLFFSTRTLFSLEALPTSLFTIFTHTLGHANWAHFTGNFIFIQLVGPLLEEKYGSWRLVKMMLVTAAATALINALFFKIALVGASGIVYMMIILASFANVRKGEVPLTFIMAAALYIMTEMLLTGAADNIAHLAHALGGLCGALFGLRYARGK